MLQMLLLFALVVVACVLCNQLTNRIGVPMLLAFIGIGMLCGEDGPLGISFENYQSTENLCTCALIFIIFYGGFSTKWSEARPVAGRSVLLSTAGVFLTAMFVGCFCHWFLGFSWLEGMLTGAVLGSTDAASVFSILRSKQLSLKYGTSSLLEVESGSNDPIAYLMTTVILSMMTRTISVGSIVDLLFTQLVFGIGAGVLLALGTRWFLRRVRLAGNGFDTILLVAVAILSYVLPTMIHGNGYLSAYICGIILGNADIPNKKKQVGFFDGITDLMQVILFFMIGLLSTPSKLPQVVLPALGIALFLTCIARPIAVSLLMTPFGARPFQQLLISWSGLRGATSAVFIVSAIAGGAALENDLFHIVFCVILLSIAIQGTLLPAVAKKLSMIDESGNVLKTFTDYTEEHELQLIQLPISEESEWAGKPVKELSLPPGTLLVMLIRGSETVIPKGDTIVMAQDTAVLTADAYEDDARIRLAEMKIDQRHEWCGKEIRNLSLSRNKLIILIRRGEHTIIPQGNVVIEAGDVVVCNSTE